LADARGDVFRGLEVVEFACGVASHMMGETVEQVASLEFDPLAPRDPEGG